MTTDPVADADDYLESIDDAAKLRAAQESLYRGIITETLTKSIMTCGWQSLKLPVKTGHKVSYEPMLSAVADYMNYGKPLVAYMDVLADSDCPLVAKLRQALADSYSNANADLIGDTTA